MTNADYYVNVYRSGWLGKPYSTRYFADYNAMYGSPRGPRIGVWRIRLKEGKR